MYSTDLEETQWQVIKKILNVQERKRKYDLREIWNAIFYVVKTGLPMAYASLRLRSLGVGLLLLSANGLLGVNLIYY